MLCFACTGGNALLQASVYFIPNRSHCCTEGIFFLFRVITLREKANVQKKSTFRVERYKQQAPGVLWCCRSSKIWVLTFLPVHSDKSRDFLSSFKKPFVRITVLLCWQKWERKKNKKPFKPLKDQIYDRLALVGPGWTVKMLALFILGENSEMKSTLQNWSVASLFSMAQLFNLE